MTPLFQDDYIFSWDFSDKDAPIVKVARMRLIRSTSRIMVDEIVEYVGTTGAMSLRQLLAKWDRERKNEEKE